MTTKRRKTKRAPKGQHVEPKALLPRGPHVRMGDGTVANPPGRSIDVMPLRPLQTPSIVLAISRRNNEAWRARHTAAEVAIEDGIADRHFEAMLEYEAKLTAWNEEQHAIEQWKKDHPRGNKI
jgi:hypothetical protein